MLELAVIGAKLAGWGNSLLILASKIPWYVWCLLICGVIIFAAEHKLSTKNAEIARDKAAYVSSLSAWQKANNINFATVQTLLSVDQRQNATITAYQSREAAAFSAAAKYKAKADKASASRDKAIAILKGAKAIKDDCAAPPEHSEVENQL